MKPTTRLGRVGDGVTHEGGRAARLTDEQKLRRSVLACLLWEDTFYEDGESIYERIKGLCGKVPAKTVTNLAIEARTKYKLRHVPMVLCRELARQSKLNPTTLAEIIRRADELYEFLALYWENGRCPVAASVKKGLAKAFIRFNNYQLAKYNRKGPVTLRDVLRICHPKAPAAAPELAEWWGQICKGTLPPPDTWEVALSAGKDKKETWTRLLAEKKLGSLAFLRNLRNMQGVGIPKAAITSYMAETDFSKVLPFRFLAAARAVPEWEDLCDTGMLTLKPAHKLSGQTILLVDVSGSMDNTLSAKSDLTGIDAACGLTILAREMSDDVRVFTFSESLVSIPPRRGMALRDAIDKSQHHNGTYLAGAIEGLQQTVKDTPARLIVITDEQAHDDVGGGIGRRRYLINVQPNEKGVGYGDWVRINGFSEATLDFIAEYERQKVGDGAG